MGVNQSGDFLIDGKPFMLVRGNWKGRAWSRTGRADTPARRSAADQRYGNLPDEIDHPEVWDDWSGGYGQPYRLPAAPNTVNWSENFDTRFPRQLVHCQQLQLLPARYASAATEVQQIYDVPLPGVASPPAGAGAVLAIGKGFIARYVPTGLNTAGSMFDFAVEATGGGITFAGRPATYGSYSYVGNANGSGFYARGHDGTVTVSDMPAGGFVTAGNRLWRYHSTNKLQSVADTALSAVFTATNWSATLNIGNGQAAIKDMMELADQVYCGLDDGLYAGDQSGTFYNVLSEIRNARHVDNARDLDVFNSGVHVPHAAGLWWYRPSEYYAEAREVSPGARGGKCPIRGRIRCVTSHGPWTYAGLWTGSQSYILSALEQTGGYAWHVMQRLPHDTKVSRIHFDSVTTPSGGGGEIPMRMWVAGEKPTDTTGTAPLYICPIPRNNDNPLTPDPAFTANYCGSARADFGTIDWGSPGTLKLFRSVEVWADNLLSGVRYADVYYKVDNGTRTYMGRAQESPVSVLYYPAERDTCVKGQSLTLSLESFTASFNMSPVYRAVVVRGSLRPRSKDTIAAVVRVADGMTDRQGNPMRPAANMLDELRSMADPDRDGSVPHLLTDLAGATMWVNVLQPVGEQEVYQVGDENPEVAATVQMAVLDFTTATWPRGSAMAGLAAAS